MSSLGIPTTSHLSYRSDYFPLMCRDDFHCELAWVFSVLFTGVLSKDVKFKGCYTLYITVKGCLQLLLPLPMHFR